MFGALHCPPPLPSPGLLAQGVAAHVALVASRITAPLVARARPGVTPPHPDADVELTASGFSLPLLKWRELLFTGALQRGGEIYVRDPAQPEPPFERAGLFPDGAHFSATLRGDHVDVVRRR